MGTMDFDGIKAQLCGVTRCAGIGLHHVPNFFGGRHGQNRFTGVGKARRAIGWCVGKMAGPWLAHHALMPNLWGNLAALRVDIFDDFCPASQSIIAMETGNIGVVRSPLSVGDCAFGDQQTNIGSCPARIIIGYILSRYTVWRERPRHRGHGNSVRDRYTADGEGLKQSRHVGHGHS